MPGTVLVRGVTAASKAEQVSLLNSNEENRYKQGTK